MAKFIEVTAAANFGQFFEAVEPILLNTACIYYIGQEPEGTKIFLTNDKNFFVEESYEDLKNLLTRELCMHFNSEPIELEFPRPLNPAIKEKT